MSFFKKLFGSKNIEGQKDETDVESLLEPYRRTPWMNDLRLESLEICLKAGFKPSSSLPTVFSKKLRPPIEIANRLHAIKALVLWLLVPEENLPNEKILNFIDRNNLEDYMSDAEKNILSLSRIDEEGRNAIGWKFENAWPLAWYFGYKEPDVYGHMMSGDDMQDILMNYTCQLSENISDWVKHKNTISEEDITKKEDLFYCLQNAARSAQMGGNTVPPNFNPISNGGVIHERRHSLTWMLSKDISWEDTDLST